MNSFPSPPTEVPATGPFQALLGYRSRLDADGTARVELVIGERHLSQYGVAHGGVALALLDTVGGLAVYARAGALRRLATASLSMNFIRTVRPGPVVALGRVEQIGGTLAHTRMELREERADGALLASAIGVYRMFRQGAADRGDGAGSVDVPSG